MYMKKPRTNCPGLCQLGRSSLLVALARVSAAAAFSFLRVGLSHIAAAIGTVFTAGSAFLAALRFRGSVVAAASSAFLAAGSAVFAAVRLCFFLSATCGAVFTALLALFAAALGALGRLIGGRSGGSRLRPHRDCEYESYNESFDLHEFHRFLNFNMSLAGSLAGDESR